MSRNTAIVIILVLVALIFAALAYRAWWADNDEATDIEDLPAAVAAYRGVRH